MRTLIVLLALLSFASGCRRKDATSWQAGYEAPIFRTTLSFQQVLGDTLFTSGAGGELLFVYEDRLDAFLEQEITDIPDTTLSSVFSLPFGNITVGPNDQLLAQSQQVKMGIPNVELSFAILRQGKASFRLINDLSQPIDISYSVPCATLNGVPLSIQTTVPPATPTQDGFVDTIIDLSGYAFDLRGLQQNQCNTITTIVNAFVNANASPMLITNQDSIRLLLEMIDFYPQYASGYFGKQLLINEQQEERLEFFKNVKEGVLNPVDLSASIRLVNYGGFDNRFRLKQLQTTKKDGSTVDLQHPSVQVNQFLNRASDYPLTPVTKVLNFNSGNSNLVELFKGFPEKFKMSFDWEINPFGNISGGHDFVYTDRLPEAWFRIEAPVSFDLSSLVLVDTLSLDSVENSGLLDQITAAKLKLVCTNYFPFSARATMRFADDLKVIADNLIIPSSVFDASGKTTEPWKGVVPFPISSELLDELRLGGAIILEVKLDTGVPNGRIVVYPEYKMELSLVAEADVKHRAGK